MFVAVTNRLGAVDACLTVAAVFLAVTLALLALHVVLRRRAAQAASLARAQSRSLIADPFGRFDRSSIFVQAVGLKRA